MTYITQHELLLKTLFEILITALPGTNLILSTNIILQLTRQSNYFSLYLLRICQDRETLHTHRQRRASLDLYFTRTSRIKTLSARTVSAGGGRRGEVR